MFTPGRYIVIDDNPEHLRQLVEALHELGAPGVGIHYKADIGVRPELLRGVRVLFLDLHLIGGVEVGQKQQAFNVIVELLETGIGPAAGPYVIVLWTSHAEQREEFEAYLVERLSAEKRPLAILKLDKNDYLSATGPANAEKLRADVTERIAEDARLHALLSWERDVLAAAGATLSALGDLIPPEDRTPAAYGEKLDEVLSVLASAAAGQGHAAADVRGAVNAALAPILSDRILNQRGDDETDAVWAKAVTRIGDGPHLDVREAARINTMLHLALPPAENVTAHDWGALVLLPEAELEDEAVKRRFALTRGQLKFNSCPTPDKAGRDRCRLALIRLGASCDYAQCRPGPIAYVLALIVPSDVVLKDPQKRSKAQIETPFLELPDLGTVRVFVDARYQISLVEQDVHEWPTACRVREQLLMQIAAHCAEYATRPGIVFIQPAEHPPEPPLAEPMAAPVVEASTVAVAVAVAAAVPDPASTDEPPAPESP